MGVRTDSPESPEFEALIKSCKNPKPHIRLYDQGLLKSPIYHAETNNKYNHVDDF
jgi:hypothetical protein